MFTNRDNFERKIQDFCERGGDNFCLENTEIFFYSETTIGQDLYLSYWIVICDPVL